jgi:hypothetical protein
VKGPSLGELLNKREDEVEIAKLFTGDYESERGESLLSYVASNDLSRRSYERLYVRWTDMLALYDDRVGNDYDAAFFPCVLIYETCVLMRRMLRSAIERMDQLYGSMAFVPRPIAFERLTSSLADLRGKLIMVPPVQSVEAERLLASAYKQFGVYQLAEAGVERSKLLETRYQWAKAVILAGVAVFTYILDKSEFLKGLKPALRSLLAKLFR